LKAIPDESLIKGYIEGVPEAHAEIHRWIQRIIDNRHWGLHHQREDIIQEVHKRLFENLTGRRFRASSSLKTYVTQIAKYTCIEFLRQKIRTSSVDLDSMELRDPSPGPEQQLASSQWTKQAIEAVASLPHGCQQLFELIFIDRLSYREIARRLAVAEGTVKSRTWRCRDALVKILKTKGIVLSEPDQNRRETPSP
jgi:RNA polymerase sigma-70 factor (ECF subfamily)